MKTFYTGISDSINIDFKETFRDENKIELGSRTEKFETFKVNNLTLLGT